MIKKDYVLFDGIKIPPTNLRPGGPRYSSNKYFYESAIKEANRLVNNLNLNPQSTILDIGCGPGRLPIGILKVLGNVKEYVGFDVDKEKIDWCQKHISLNNQNFKFKFINVKSERYNPTGNIAQSKFQLPLQENSFDIIYLSSVFTHLLVDDIKAYLQEFSRLLKLDGNVFVTMFVEDDVPNLTINPPEYGQNFDIRPLHFVRYNRIFFEQMVKKYNLKIKKLEYKPPGKQSIYFLSK